MLLQKVQQFNCVAFGMRYNDVAMFKICTLSYPNDKVNVNDTLSNK